MTLASNLTHIRSRIDAAIDRAGRMPGSVELLPVSKRHPAVAVREAMALGLTTFGENYVQEGAAKAAEVPEARFHLIGPLQRNKAKAALQAFHVIQSLDRPELATRLRHLAEELQVVRPVWIQVDLWGEETKMGGCPEEGLSALLAALGGDSRLPLQGFMAIPPPELPTAFQDLADLRERWQDRLGQPLRLSMGMSDDLEAAIQAGSDQIRIGTALFGLRIP